jgi:hypothetical protein
MNIYVVLVVFKSRKWGTKTFFVEVPATSKSQAWGKACDQLVGSYLGENPGMATGHPHRFDRITTQDKGAMNCGGMKVKVPTVGGMKLVAA